MTKAYSCLPCAPTSAVSQPSLQDMLQDLVEAQSLQQHARPRSGQKLAGLHFQYRIVAARYLSGDALDFFCLPDGRVLAYLLDASGQGAAAALLSMFIKSSVRHSMAMAPDNGPAQVLADVNQMLLEADMHKYATMLCFIFSPQNNSLEWSHAGHMPRPLLLEQGKARLLQGQNPPVGLFADANYPAEQLSLEQDFSLCLCSDGVLDQLDGDTLQAREQFLCELLELEQGNFARLAQQLCPENVGGAADDRSLFVIDRATHG